MTTPTSKTEWKLILLILILGVVVRFVNLSHSAVEHFDEGVYTSNIMFETGAYPARHLYAPPLFPFLVEISQLFLQSTTIGSLLVSLLAGCGTIVLIWQVGRRWFGPECGIAAATLAAFSDFHILYSRMVLTDVLLCFWLLLAVWLIWETFRHADYRLAAAAGVATGLAWATKYNGWLAIAIGISGLIAWGVTTGASAKTFKQNILLWVIIAIVAVTVWSPVWFGLPEPGYSAVSKNHARYIVGLEGWWDSAVRQYRNHRFLDGWLSALSIGFALLFAQILRDIRLNIKLPSFTWNGLINSFVILFVKRLQLPIALTGIALLIGSTSLLFLLALLAFIWIAITHWKNRRSIKMNHSDWMTSLAFWLLSAWMIGLIVATPFYTPYPRLTLPLLVALWLTVALLASRYTEFFVPPAPDKEQSTSPKGKLIQTLSFIGTMLIVAVAYPQISKRQTVGWKSRTGLEQIAQETTTQLQQAANLKGLASEKVILYIYAEPALFYHIRKEMPLTVPAGNLQFASAGSHQQGIPTFFLFGPHANHDSNFNKEWQQVKHQFQLIKSYDYLASDLVLLNQHDPKTLNQLKDSPVEKISLYRLRD